MYQSSSSLTVNMQNGRDTRGGGTARGNTLNEAYCCDHNSSSNIYPATTNPLYSTAPASPSDLLSASLPLSPGHPFSVLTSQNHPHQAMSLPQLPLSR